MMMMMMMICLLSRVFQREPAWHCVAYNVLTHHTEVQGGVEEKIENFQLCHTITETVQASARVAIDHEYEIIRELLNGVIYSDVQCNVPVKCSSLVTAVFLAVFALN